MRIIGVGLVQVSKNSL